MTNEKLCERIQDGETDLLAQLLDQNRGIIHKLARRYLPYVERRGGADYDDLSQAASLGMIIAADHWQAARGGFLTVAMLYMRSALRDLAGIATSKRGIESVMTMLPLDAPIDQDNPDSANLSEAVADESAINPVDACADADLIEQVREAVNELPPAPQDAIRRVYFDGERWPPDSAARRTIQKGLRLLYRNKRIRALRDQYEAACYRNKGVRGFSTSWSSVVEDAVIQREKWTAELERIRAELKELTGSQKDEI